MGVKGLKGAKEILNIRYKLNCYVVIPPFIGRLGLVGDEIFINLEFHDHDYRVVKS